MKLSTQRQEQDQTQKVSMAGTLLMEMYRVLMGSFLLLFVPQYCVDENDMCSMSSNMYVMDPIFNVGQAINIVTFLSFLAMYYFEVVRELRMIDNLDVNTSVANDNESVKEALITMDKDQLQLILSSDKMYQLVSYNALVWFAMNSSYSGVVIGVTGRYLDSKTVTVFFTNILFLFSKIYDAYQIAHTEDYIFYSAYLKQRVQFNDIDIDIDIANDDKEKEEKEEEDSMINGIIKDKIACAM